MFKRFVVTVMVGISAAGILSSSAEAHLAGSIGGWHYASLGCSVTIEDTTTPGKVQCVAQVLEFDVRCTNKQGNQIIQAGVSAYNTVLVGTGLANEGQTTAGSGTETINIHVSTDALLDDPSVCFTPDKAKWIPVEVLVRRFIGNINITTCRGPNCNTGDLTSQLDNGECTLDPVYTLTNKPPLDPPTFYQCANNTDWDHLR
jgi:hypothetical protein